MKLPLVAAAAAAVVGSALASGQAPAPAPAPGTAIAQPGPEPKDLKAKVSYGFGLNLGKNFQAQGIDLDPDLILRGMKEGMAGGKLLYTEAELQEATDAFRQGLEAKQAELNQKRIAEASKQGAANKTKGAAFLAANKSKPGVVTLPSGLQYQVLTPGTGASPKPTDSVTVNYEGKLLDGTVFDSSYQRKLPITFRLDQVIKGWTEGLQQMQVGAKYRLFIPAELAYGAQPRPDGPIPPNATLIFDVELLGIGAQP